MKKPVLGIISLFFLMIVIVNVYSARQTGNINGNQPKTITKTGVCPPFFLYDQQGQLINPVAGINADQPYSPKQTCGKCHDYDLITQGYHFQQGKDETASGVFADRFQWVTTPGNYGGNWCSPAPLYRALAHKSNQSAKEIDMTSFDFITASCGACHPGGGPMEYDRNGFRYDLFMKDSSNHMKPMAANNYDGDYFKANWLNTGVIEADCQLCHLPEYNFKERNNQLAKWNFQWAATQGSGLAIVAGSIKDSTEISVNYDLSKFDKEGKVALHLVREVRNETCLNCHAKPDWKKKGTSYSSRRDVHIQAGLKCVDCHPAGSKATDDRIRLKESHQFGKGDDPSGNVRNDLDNTLRDCKDCHLKGYLNAPIANHSWLPPLHLEKIACQTCHIPERSVKAALVQVSDVYNPGTKISPPGKHIWTFYDQHLNYWNHYGELEMFTAKDQPTDPFTPSLASYKGMIYPMNMVHSAWPGIYTAGVKGLNQPKMADIYQMWTMHRKDKTVYPQLSIIKDDNADSIPEVNTAAEIDAFISSVKSHLLFKGYELGGKEIVWVNNDKMYFTGEKFQLIEKEIYEASPYASVHKFSHDVAPAKAALGTKGCVDCHATSSEFFFAETLKYPFDEKGQPITEPQYKRMGISPFMAYTGAYRESILKPLLYFLFAGLILIIFLHFLINSSPLLSALELRQKRVLFGLAYILLLVAGIFSFSSGELISYMLPGRRFLDANHFVFSAFILFVGTWFYFTEMLSNKLFRMNILSWLILLTAMSGMLMLFKWEAVSIITGLSYTLFDIGLIGVLISLLIQLKPRQV